ncbi:MAG: peptide chain release factor 1 [Bacteroidetes bacterium]|nr:peptide chain release factor 1 [Bacteroidota bacterium]MBU1679101.1 peptide chain release factor 1 [Bacteroidota bacterium]MBU2506185.1 peptide chain release factor 1 [Bacteroidota bacterium]
MDIISKLREIKEKYSKINEKLSDQDIVLNQELLIKLSRERSELQEVVEAFDRYNVIIKNIEGNQEIINSKEDKDLAELAEMELEDLIEKKNTIEEEIKALLLPKDPSDDKDVILEIRAGTGGDEAGLFAADLLRMYTRFAELKGWKMELMDLNEASMGGIKEAVAAMRGKGVYGDLKFESGVHRVQRVPATEASGRVHTSAASVVVLPEVEDVEVEIDMGDLRIDVYRSGGAGGQNVNKVETAIRITHIPTGLVVQCQDERSQLKNRHKALKVLKSRLYDLKLREQNNEVSAQRKLMVKSGDRSDKIRTYNFPQNRVTDHRIGLTLYNLSNIVEGDLYELIEKLKIADHAERLKQG